MTAYKLYLVIMKEQKTTKKKNRNMRDPLTDMYNSLGIAQIKRISVQQGGRNMKIQPAVKKETRRVAMITAVGLILMWILFAVLHFTMPDKVPLDYTVF